MLYACCILAHKYLHSHTYTHSHTHTYIHTVDGIDNIPKVTHAYYGTSHARTGVLAQLSCMSIKGGGFCGCMQFTDPLISPALGADMTRRLVMLLNEVDAAD